MKNKTHTQRERGRERERCEMHMEVKRKEMADQQKEERMQNGRKPKRIISKYPRPAFFLLALPFSFSSPSSC